METNWTTFSWSDDHKALHLDFLKFFFQNVISSLILLISLGCDAEIHFWFYLLSKQINSNSDHAMPSYLLIFSSTVIIEITLTSFKQLQMLFKTRLWWFREKHNIISDPHQSLLLSFIKFSTFSYLHEKVYFGISEPHRKVWSYHKRPTSTENCEGRFIPSRFLRGGMTFLSWLLNNQAKYSDRWEKHGYS